MNPEQQRIAIAEACGWKTGYRDPEAWHPLPDYLNDLNAMHEAEKILTDEQSKAYTETLWVIVKRESTSKTRWQLWHATAAQRAEAFLRTTGKWETSQ